MADTKISGFTDAVTANATDRLAAGRSPFTASTDSVYITPAYLGTYFAKNVLAAGTITTSQPHSLTQTWNAAVTFDGALINITHTAGNAASQLLNVQTGGTQRLGLRAPHIALGTDATAFLNLVDVWNTSGAPTGIKFNVTNTASSASSLLMDLQVGAVSKFKVTLTGGFDAAGESNQRANLYMVSGGGIYFRQAAQLAIGSTGDFGFTSGADAAGTSIDARIRRGASGSFVFDDNANTFTSMLLGGSGTTYNMFKHESAGVLGLKLTDDSAYSSLKSLQVNTRPSLATPAAASSVAAVTMGSSLIGIYFGSGSPNTALTAPKGSLYLRSDGTGVADRLFINTDSSTTWTAIATAG